MLLAVGALVAAGLPAPTSAAEPRGIVIRVYDYAGMSSWDVERARTTSEQILLTADVRPTWWNCGPIVPAAPAPCDHPLTPNQFVVRILGAPARPSFVLGYSLIDKTRLTGQVATVFGERIRQTSARLRIDSGVLLGRVIAHEVGHLLMGTTTHAYAGIMSARWSDTVLQHGTPVDWRFHRDEAERVERHLADRSTLPPGVITLAELRRLP